MKSFISFCFLVSVTFFAQSQCNVIATAMPTSATCSGICDGQITYVYQNLNMSSPGAPYIVSLEDSDGNTLSFTTYMTEITTIPFTNLCADTYTITVQGTTCSFTTYATVTEPSEIVAYANTTDPSFGASNGSAEIIASGGTGAFTYSLDGITYQGSNTFTGLAAGAYTAYVQDANGCIGQVDFTLTDVTSCNVVVTANPTANPMCYGSCSGSLQYYYFDGNNNSPYYIELIQGGVTLQTATNNSPNGNGIFSNLCAGVYYVQVTDAQGCVGSYPITISQPSQLLITGVNTTDASAGNNDGSASITASGGLPVYTYSLDGITYQSSNIFTGLAAGVYIGYVQDNAGCISIFTFVIQTNPGCFFNLVTTGNSVSCNWSCDGTVSYIFSGAPTDPPFSIVLEDASGNAIQNATSPNQTVTGSFTNLCAGNYTVTVTNASGCSEVSNVTISQPTALIANPSQTNPTFGNSDGSITVSVSGGTAPYQFSIDNQVTWQASNTFTGLATGVYIIHIQDANGCMTLVCVFLTESTGCDFFMNTTAAPNSCSGNCDGSISWNFNDVGNNPPYTIDLIQGTNIVQTQNVTASNGGFGTFSNLCEGTYLVQITDDNGCTDTDTLYVNAPDYLYVSSADVTNATAGNSDGEAFINVVGGTAPYQFSFDNGVTWTSSNPVTGLAAGFYIMYVQDANGCQTIFCFIVNEDPGCNIVTTLFATGAISCNGSCDGALGAAYNDIANNGPYTITLNNDGTGVNTSTQASNNFTLLFTNLCAGNYSIVVTDASGCSSLVSNTTLTQPDALNISADVTNASVGNSNGSAEINVTGGTGQYMYSLNNIDFQTSNIFDGLAAGTYIVYVEDENGCSAIFTFLVSENTNCNIVLTAFSTAGVSCSGACDATIGFAFNDVNVNPPYTVTLSNVLGGSSGSQVFTTGNGGSGNFTNVCSGTYIVSVQDANGCESFYTVQIVQPDYLLVGGTQINATSANGDGSININATGGTPPYQYSIDNQVTWQASDVFTNLSAGFYIIYVQDANGCTQIVCFILDDNNVAGVIELTNEISVYPNPTQGTVFVQSASVEVINVYDLNGKLIPASTTVAANGMLLDLSVFEDGMYLIEIKSTTGEIKHVRIVKQ